MNVIARVKARELTGYRALAASLMGAALTAACAQISFHLPGNPVPVTMQVFAAVLCGMALGGKLGALSQIEYLAAGLAGAPIFADFKAGPAAIVGPTGGYIVGFILAALVVGLVAERSRRTFAHRCVAGFIGVAVIYTFGRAWFAVWLGELTGVRSWLLGVAPFVGVDAAKVMLAAAISSQRKSFRAEQRGVEESAFRKGPTAGKADSSLHSE